MRIGICDDQRKVRELLGRQVERICPQAELTCYASGDELLEAKEQPQVLLLDIQMPGQDGMETARQLRKRNQNMILIFITALEEYVFEAFDVGAFHYLVKPFSEEKLREVLERAREQYQEQEAARQAAQMAARQTALEEKSIMVKTGGSHIRILWKDIIYAEVFNRKVTIHSTRGDVEYYGRLGELEKQLGEDFYRPHRAYLVHFKYVVKYTATAIVLEQGTALMAKQNYTEFVRHYLAYHQRKGLE
ncbi:MAG: response regulator transcription factor [Lachnospiraceae bacterium]|nr:response regulator transcription factor [Lachnospiraceae bacterium]MCI9149395.1 response regulator transcription factor [Lachnospiraceae bacterium]